MKCLSFVYRILLFGCMCLPIMQASLAQQSFRHLAAFNELRGKSINDIQQDAKGRIWLATQGGLYFFNGKGCRQVSQTVQVNKLLIIGDSIFYASPRGVYVYTPRFGQKSYLFLPVEGDIIALSYWENKLCVAIKDSALMLVHIPTKSLTVLAFSDMFAYHQAQVGNELWIKNYGQLFKLYQEAGEVKLMLQEWDLPPNSLVQTYCTDGKGYVYLVGESGEIWVADAQKKIIDTIPLPEKNNYEQVCKVGDDLVLCVGTKVYRYLPDLRFWLVHDLKQLEESEQGVTALFTDKDYQLWIGGKSAGLFCYDLSFDNLSEHLSPTPSPLAAQAVMCLRSGGIVFTDGRKLFGMLSQNGKCLATSIRMPFTLPANCIITCMRQDSLGNYWLGTFNHGVYTFHPAKPSFRHYSTANGLDNDNVLWILPVKESVWLCTFGGVSRINSLDGKITNYNTENGFSSTYTYQAVWAAPVNLLYFGSDGKGLIKFDYQTFTPVLGVEDAQSFYSLSYKDGRLVALSNKADLWDNHGGKWAKKTLNHLGVSGIQTLAFDFNGQLLLGYNGGFLLLDKNLNLLRNFSEVFPMGKIEPVLNGYDYGGSRMFWATSKGLMLYTNKPADAVSKPDLILDSVSVALRAVDFEQQKQFEHDQNYLTFYFSALWYAAPQALSFRYKIKGIHQDWLYTQDPFVNVVNLPPGRYTFVAEAALYDNFSAENPQISYDFEVLSPIWLRTWFLLLCCLLIVFTLWAFWKWREKQMGLQAAQKKQKLEFELRNLKNQINPHFLFNTLSTLAGAIEESPAKAVVYVEKLAQFYRNITSMGNVELVSLRKELLMLDDYLYILSQRFEDNIVVEIQVPDHLMEHQLPIFSLQMLIENAVKHNVASQSKPLKVSIQQGEKQQLEVINPIQPKHNLQDSTGMGLKNIDDRFRILTGRGIEYGIQNNNFVVRFYL